MIQFNETTEKKDLTELLSSPAIKAIIPERLSPQDARGFWDNLFAGNVQSEAQEINEDDLWGEIFGRTEEEFQFDFEIDKGLKSILAKLDSPELNDLADNEKVSIVEQFVATLADRLDIKDIPKVVFFDGAPTALGAFSLEDNCVKINSALLQHPPLLKEVIPHEMRHAYQHQRAAIQETWMDILYLINFDNYISPVWLSDNTCLYFTDYQGQLVEAEARAFANLFA